MSESVLKKLKPEIVWEYFFKICEIPHMTGHESLLAEIIKGWAEEKNISSWFDDAGNLILKKKATSKNIKNGIILHAHLDIICAERENKSPESFLEPIKITSDGKFVWSENNCLGADNGIGIAVILALMLSDEVEHGSLEAVLSSRNVHGFSTLFSIEPNFLEGKYFISLDSVENKCVYTGSAGGIDVLVEKNLTFEDMPSDHCVLEFKVNGLKGGHSGLDINIPHGNAIKILIRLIWNLAKIYDIRISSISGGVSRYQIPVSAKCRVGVLRTQVEDLSCAIDHYREVLAEEFQGCEPQLKISVNMENEIEKVISIDDQKEILNAIYACPHGALRMNPVVFENVENSCNLGRVEFINEKFLMETSQRSSRNSLKVDAANQVRCIFENIDAKVDFIGHYDGWVPDWNSKLLFLVESIHEELFKIPIKKKIVHAGVECAKIKSIYPEIDVIVIGTDIKNPGTLKEKVMVPGVSIFWKFIKEIINKIDSVSVL